MAKNKFGGFGGGGMGGLGNMGNLMKQAQDMQKKMQETQERLESEEVEATAGGGAVKVVANGKREIKEIVIDPEVISAEDAEMLQDLVCAAVNEALRKVNELTETEMGKVTGGLNMNIPGF